MNATRDVSVLAERAVLTTVLGIAALASYIHLRQVWQHTGSPVPDLGPLLVDGLFAAAWLRMRRRRSNGEPVGWLAWAALGLALAATVAGNIAAAVITGHRDPLSLVVAAWPAIALALTWELVTGHGRNPAVVAEVPSAAVEPPAQVAPPIVSAGATSPLTAPAGVPAVPTRKPTRVPSQTPAAVKQRGVRARKKAAERAKPRAVAA